jgi:hypothetical protein
VTGPLRSLHSDSQFSAEAVETDDNNAIYLSTFRSEPASPFVVKPAASPRLLGVRGSRYLPRPTPNALTTLMQNGGPCNSGGARTTRNSAPSCACVATPVYRLSGLSPHRAEATRVIPKRFLIYDRDNKAIAILSLRVQNSYGITYATYNRRNGLPPAS